jgi:hypothetical protein
LLFEDYQNKPGLVTRIIKSEKLTRVNNCADATSVSDFESSQEVKTKKSTLGKRQRTYDEVQDEETGLMFIPMIGKGSKLAKAGMLAGGLLAISTCALALSNDVST